MPFSKLPPTATQKLVKPIQDAINTSLKLPTWHTLPVHNQIWSIYADNVHSHLREFGSEIKKGPKSGDFQDIKTWIDNVVRKRSMVLSTTLALSPFEHFEEHAAREMLGSIDLVLLRIMQELQDNEDPTIKKLPHLPDDWLTPKRDSPKDLIATAFNVSPEGLRDENGEFIPGHIFSAYYLRNGELLQRILPHLGSLGLPELGDLLVAVSTIGWVLSCEDPIAAYCSLNAFMNGLNMAHGSQVVESSLKYLEQSGQQLRQGRMRANRLLGQITKGGDDETSYLALAELYKRLVEGPFRKYGWVLYCLRLGHWSTPPMLTQLRDLLVSQGGWLGNLAQLAIIRDMRNGEAHETLVWDGVKGKFIAELAEVEPRTVAHATILADAFARGCEAAVASYRTLKTEHSPSRPQAEDLGRLAPWQRAEAIFGTNGIRVVHAKFNSKTVGITCLRLRYRDINPCLQSLVACLGLLPHAERFEVVSLETGETVIEVSRDALERVVPIWETALAKLSAMPLSTFLPANLDARSKYEGMGRAVRSAAWIAVDDFLDALDSSAQQWNTTDLELFTCRVTIVARAVAQCLDVAPERTSVRLHAVRDAAREMLTWLDSVSVPIAWGLVAQREPVAKFRHWWNEWGPVDRLPTISTPERPTGEHDYHPTLRDDPQDLRWRTI